MKNLVLLRHAKSSWENPGLDDFDRPLAPRGKKDAPKIGRALATASSVPDVVVCSTAKRARQTADLVLEAAGYSGTIRHEDRIYEASVETLLDVIRSIDESAETAMLVGHNPGFEMLASALVGPKSHAASIRFPTSTLARIELASGAWSQVGPGAGTLIWQLVPRCL